MKDSELRSIKHIDKIMDRGYLNIAFLLICLKDIRLDDTAFMKAFNYHKTEIEVVRDKLEKFPLNNVPRNSIDDFLTIQENFEILKSMLSEIHIKNSTPRQEIIQTLNIFPFVETINTIVKSHKNFFESSKSMLVLISEIKTHESSEKE